MKKLTMSWNIIYKSLGEISVFRKFGVLSLVILLLTYFILSIQFIFFY
ncbi:hypothetical protein [Flavobacterium sp. ALD4]|nr:hypothetical protein [Flavobacterium sp. ALD4]